MCYILLHNNIERTDTLCFIVLRDLVELEVHWYNINNLPCEQYVCFQNDVESLGLKRGVLCTTARKLITMYHNR